MTFLAPELIESLRDLLPDEDIAALTDVESLDDAALVALLEKITATAESSAGAAVEVAGALIGESRRRTGLTAAAPAPALIHFDRGAEPRGRVPLSAIAARQPSATKPRADAPSTRAITALIASASGGEFADLTDVGREMGKALDNVAPGGRVRVGSIRRTYPRDQVLGLTPDLDAVQGLIASGGICAPVTVRYEAEMNSDASRPLRDGLPSFNADRGGIQFVPPPVLPDIVVDDTGGAVTTITAAQDASSATKTVQEVSCGSATTVNVRAIAERLRFSNFADRYNPERMRAYVALGMAAHARKAERLLFADMETSSTLINGGAVWVGAARQWLGNVLAAAAGQRYRQRLADTATQTAVLPEWFAQMVAVDLMLQAPGDSMVDGIDGKAWITRVLAPARVRPIFQRDDRLTNNALGAGAPAFTTQTGSGATAQDFPGRMTTLLFPAGAFLFLDGGSLDFGIVRDSSLNATNRFEHFYESFEGVAFVGTESLAIVTQVCASGQAVAPTSTAKCGGIGS